MKDCLSFGVIDILEREIGEHSQYGDEDGQHYQVGVRVVEAPLGVDILNEIIGLHRYTCTTHNKCNDMLLFLQTEVMHAPLNIADIENVTALPFEVMMSLLSPWNCDTTSPNTGRRVEKLA